MTSRRIYLDTSVYNRPFDDLTQPRIWFEAAAFAIIFELVEQGSVEFGEFGGAELRERKQPATATQSLGSTLFDAGYESADG